MQVFTRDNPGDQQKPYVESIDPGHHSSSFSEWADAELQRKETAGIVRDAITRLPESYRTILLLRDVEELDTAEAAAALGITATAVKVRLHRARQALRTLLDREFRGRV